MKRFTTAIRAFFVVTMVALAVPAAAQTYEDAVTAYNQGDELAKQNRYRESIAAFERVVNISGSLGEQGAEIRRRAEGQIPQLYMAIGIQSARAENWAAAEVEFQRTITEARKYNNQQIAQRAEQFLMQVYVGHGTETLQAGDNEAAIALFDKALGIQQNYAAAYYNKGLAYRNLDNLEQALANFDRAIQLGTGRNRQVGEAATSAARNFLLLLAAREKEAKRFDDAIQYLKQALQYQPEDAELHYRLAEIYNVRAEFDLALESANKALTFEQGGPVDRARIWFEVGTAQKFKGNVSAACEAYKNASYGDFRASSEHAMTHELKCGT